MTGFTPVSALLGGLLLGLSVVGMLAFLGRVTGISGIFGGLLQPKPGDVGWRAAFVLGLVGGVALYIVVGGPLADIEITGSWPLLVGGGLLVGFGARLGSGCTSGHAVCGMARLSPRSAAATVTFMAAAGATVYIVRLAGGG